MSRTFKPLPLFAVAAALALSACTAVAERPVSAGAPSDARVVRDRDDRDGRTMRDERERRVERDERYDDRRGDRRNGSRVEVRVGGYFGDRDREAVRDYNRKHDKKARNCPPGLAKKGNGCQPPGQAKKWSVGKPLPRDVVYSPVEAEVRVRLGTPPAGHEFVRVASDILLIAVGTSMVIDAIEDLQR